MRLALEVILLFHGLAHRRQFPCAVRLVFRIPQRQLKPIVAVGLVEGKARGLLT